MSRTKYLKFGARADRNLSDLANPVDALNNILNDLSSQLDENGNKLRFTSADIQALIGISDQGLAETIGADGRPILLESLAGTNLQATTSDNSLVDVAPKITYQDYINNYRTILGDPLWTAGGPGPEATFIPSDRLNANTQGINSQHSGDEIIAGQMYRIVAKGSVNDNKWDEISGLSGSTYVDDSDLGAGFCGDVFTAVGNGDSHYATATVRNVSLPTGDSGTVAAANLAPDELFTTVVDSNLVDLVGPEDFWTNGDFRFSYKIHESFEDVIGGIQWEGYQSARFTVGFKTTAYFVLEEDVNGDDNWTTLKAVIEDEYKTAFPVTYDDADNGNTRIKFHFSGHDFVRVCEGMTVELNGISVEVARTYRTYNSTNSQYDYFADLDQNVGNTQSSPGRQATFLTDVNEEKLTTGEIPLTQVPRGGRRRVRYTAYWGPRPQFQDIENKYFNEYDPRDNGSLNFNYFYSDDGSSDTDGFYTFKYFFDNRVSFTNQRLSKDISVEDTISLEYVPPQDVDDGEVFVDTNVFAEEIGRKLIQIRDSSGAIIGEDVVSTTFRDVDVGDWIVVCLNTSSQANGTPSGVYYAYQILEKKSNSLIYVNESYTTLGIGEHVLHDVLFVKNQGLKGIYQSVAVAVGGDQQKKQIIANINTDKAGVMNRPFDTYVEVGDLGYKASYDLLDNTGNTIENNRLPYRISSWTPSTLTGLAVFEAHPKSATAAGVGNSVTFSGPGGTTGGNNGIMAIYSSKGLQDSSAKHECGGVYGLEVKVPPGGAPGYSNLSGGNRIYVTDLSDDDQTDYYVYFVGSDPATPVIDQYDIGATSTKITGQNTTDNYIEISTALNADLAPGTTLVVVPDTSYSGNTTELRKNREYCVIPLNTAPPFASTDDGLATTSTYPNLMVSDLEFETLEVHLASSEIVDLETVTWAGDGTPNKNIDIQGPNESGGTSTYKILINSGSYTT